MSADSEKVQQFEPVQALWIGDTFSELSALCARSFLEMGHPYHLYTYAPVQNLPSGVLCKDATEILPKTSVYRTKSRGYAPFSDWFRFALMDQRGGYYVDTDVFCLKPLDFTNEVVFGYEHFVNLNNAVVCLACLRLPKGHPIAGEILAQIDRHANRRIRSALFGAMVRKRPLPWKEIRGLLRMRRQAPWDAYKVHALASLEDVIGPTSVTEHLRRYWPRLLEESALSPSAFFPIPPHRFHEIFDRPAEAVVDRLASSYTVHFWANMVSWAQNTSHHATGMHSQSFYAQILNRFTKDRAAEGSSYEIQ